MLLEVQDNQSEEIWTDSTVEFFFATGADAYCNLEVTCGGPPAPQTGAILGGRSGASRCF